MCAAPWRRAPPPFTFPFSPLITCFARPGNSSARSGVVTGEIESARGEGADGRRRLTSAFRLIYICISIIVCVASLRARIYEVLNFDVEGTVMLRTYTH